MNNLNIHATRSSQPTRSLSPSDLFPVNMQEVPIIELPHQSIDKMVSDFSSLANKSEVGLRVSPPLLHRFAASLGAKRFLILSGLAGSGKTKIAQAFARWMTPESAAYALIPVGADWTGSDAVLGYPDGLINNRYVSRPALNLIQRAAQPGNESIPHFLILDEMNLSHVERYFADLLSLIESEGTVELYKPDLDASGAEISRSGVDPLLKLPPNLFIIGTVNVDETTYMFSPKVLDRANVIEFNADRADLKTFLANPSKPDLDKFNKEGLPFAAAFVAESGKSLTIPDSVKDIYASEMLLFFDILRANNAEYGFRVANEAARFMHFYEKLSSPIPPPADWFKLAMDAVIVQKFLPKLHGSRPKLEGLLWALIHACGTKRTPGDSILNTAFTNKCLDACKAQDEALSPKQFDTEFEKEKPDVLYPLSFKKLMRMHRKLIRDQFVTFSEA